jgi:hypothetical protein
MHVLFTTRRYFMVLLIRNIYNGFIACPSLLEAVGIRVTVRNIIDFNTRGSVVVKALCYKPEGRGIASR